MMSKGWNDRCAPLLFFEACLIHMRKIVPEEISPRLTTRDSGMTSMIIRALIGKLHENI
jgi:hypothetical protein